MTVLWTFRVSEACRTDWEARDNASTQQKRILFIMIRLQWLSVLPPRRKERQGGMAKIRDNGRKSKIINPQASGRQGQTHCNGFRKRHRGPRFNFALPPGQDGFSMVLPEYSLIKDFRQGFIGLPDGTKQAVKIPDNPFCNITIPFLRFLQYRVILFLSLLI